MTSTEEDEDFNWQPNYVVEIRIRDNIHERVHQGRFPANDRIAIPLLLEYMSHDILTLLDNADAP